MIKDLLLLEIVELLRLLVPRQATDVFLNPQWARGRQPHIAYLNLLPGTQKSRMPYSKVPGIRKCPKMGGPGPQRWIRALGEETGNPILSTFEYEMFAIWYRPFPFFASLRGCRLSLTR